MAVGERYRSKHDGWHDQFAPGGVAADCCSRPAELNTENELQHETDDERRHRDEQEADDESGSVKELSLAQSSDESNDDAKDSFEGKSEECEASGDGEGLSHDIGDRTARERSAEVTLE